MTKRNKTIGGKNCTLKPLHFNLITQIDTLKNQKQQHTKKTVTFLEITSEIEVRFKK